MWNQKKKKNWTKTLADVSILLDAKLFPWRRCSGQMEREGQMRHTSLHNIVSIFLSSPSPLNPSTILPPLEVTDRWDQQLHHSELPLVTTARKHMIFTGAVLTPHPPASYTCSQPHYTRGKSHTDMCIICIWLKTLLKHACLNPSAPFTKTT